MAPHMGSATPEQIDTLLNFMDEHRDLARSRGRFRSGEGNAREKTLWEELCNMLNSMGGCTKTIQQWQKVWFHKKQLAKKAAVDFWRSASATGGGPSLAPPLSDWQLRILSITGVRCGERQTGARVPAFSETNEPIPFTSSHTSTSPSFSQQIKNLSQEDGPLSEPASQPMVAQESLTSTLSSQPTRPRRRHSAADSDFRTRLFQYEEGRVQRETVRNTELAGIRAALLQLSGLLQEYLDRRN